MTNKKKRFPSLIGTTSLIETVVFINPRLQHDRQTFFRPVHAEVTIPSGHKYGEVGKEIYDKYRQAYDGACADIVITTHLPGGEPAVLASKRILGKPFGGKWWMQGGSIRSYQRMDDFVVKCAERECGVHPGIQGLIGVFRTCAEDFVTSTLNVCYVGFISYDTLIGARPDMNHSDQRLLTIADLNALPESERHWYPMEAFKLALTTMP